MSRRAALLVLGVVLVGPFAACTRTPSLEPETVERVASCDALVPIGAELVRRLAEAVEGAPLETVTGEAPPSDELTALRAIGEEVDLRASHLGCDPAALNATINEETADLTTDDPVVQVLLDIVREGVVSTRPPAPTTPPPLP